MTRSSLVASSVAYLAMVSGFSLVPEPYGKCRECDDKNPCGPGHYCDKGGCNSCKPTDGGYKQGCDDDADCEPSGNYCQRGKCYDGRNGDQCMKSSDCLKNGLTNYCKHYSNDDDGKCECTSPCPAGSYCSDDSCKPTDGTVNSRCDGDDDCDGPGAFACATNNVCTDGKSGSPCDPQGDVNIDCAPGYYCFYNDGPNDKVCKYRYNASETCKGTNELCGADAPNKPCCSGECERHHAFATNYYLCA
eukprot:CAMPEP_0183338762 /NCGR_PEP_ID=MMETSP0164_2-20130417/5936_1 /TAXON_ID=221442 /ORGANISM="Coccolithus pelagicus ssp braarudi, Strain PLY182g" /LENGTH=246 /DNA_ID=CAMNT_0025508661 /DNA_START=36 /DNA_END=776 /DNA_ORIENTATION=+